VLNVLDRHTIGRLLRSRDVGAWGVASNEPQLNPRAPALPTAISVLMPLEPAVVRGLRHGPTGDYREEYHRVNAALDGATATLASVLVERGHEAVTIPATSARAASDNGRVPVFPHKTAATQAGLGWIGKTALFVSTEFGPSVRLATVFTDLELPAGDAVTQGRCGECRACVEACPADCGRDVQWRAGMPLAELFDAGSCRHHMEQYDQLDEEICGICIAACPLSKI
jgi:epoxyqueuosine reductase